MLTLSVIAVENGAIIAASESGERYRIPVDAQVRARLNDPRVDPKAKRLSPREIQAHIRAGLSAQQVASLTGAPVSDIERFVGPVMAEREYVVESALAIRVQSEAAEGKPRPFGSVLTERLEALAAVGVRWTSAKAVGAGWMVQVSFTADDIEHEARWQVDLKRQQLVPDNVEATTLSQLGTPAALTPRLHAVAEAEPVDSPLDTATAPLDLAEVGAYVPAGAGRDTRPSSEAARRAAGIGVADAGTDEPREEAVRDSFEILQRADGADEDPAEEAAGADAHASDPLTPTDDEVEPATHGDAVDLAALRAQRGEPERGDAPRAGLLASLEHRRNGRGAAADGAESAPVEPEPHAAGLHDFDPFAFLDEDDDDPFRPQPVPERDEPAQVTRGRFPDALPEPEPKQPAPPLKRPRSRGRLGRRQEPPAEPEQTEGEARPAPTTNRPRRGRTTMPSWDEIVYGRDDD